MDHLLIHCNVAFELRSFVFRSFRIQWVLLDEVFDLLCEWQNGGVNHLFDTWILIPSLFFYTSGLMHRFLQIVLPLCYS